MHDEGPEGYQITELGPPFSCSSIGFVVAKTILGRLLHNTFYGDRHPVTSLTVQVIVIERCIGLSHMRDPVAV